MPSLQFVSRDRMSLISPLNSNDRSIPSKDLFYSRSSSIKNKTGLICQLCFLRILGSRMFLDFCHYNWTIYIQTITTQLNRYPHFMILVERAGLFFWWWKLQRAFRTARLDANRSEANYNRTQLHAFSHCWSVQGCIFDPTSIKNKTGLICQLCFWRILGSRMFLDFSHYNWAIYVQTIMSQLNTSEPPQHGHYLNATLPNRVIYLSYLLLVGVKHPPPVSYFSSAN